MVKLFIPNSIPDKAFVQMISEEQNKSGLIEAKGAGRGRSYMLGEKAYRKTDGRIAYVRQSDIDALRHEELIVKLAEKQGKITRSDVASLLHLNEAQAYRKLKKLADKDVLVLHGKGNGAHYTLK